MDQTLVRCVFHRSVEPYYIRVKQSNAKAHDFHAILRKKNRMHRDSSHTNVVLDIAGNDILIILLNDCVIRKLNR